MEPTEPNGPTFDTRIAKNRGEVVEWEQRYQPHGAPGRAAPAGIPESRARRHVSGRDPGGRRHDLGPTRRPGTKKYGFGVNLEQEITRDIGAFARYGWSDGKTEAWAFTQIDRSLSGGISIGGELWKRKGDTIGIAGVRNYLSGDERSFLAAGGLGLHHWRRQAELRAGVDHGSLLRVARRPGVDVHLGLPARSATRPIIGTGARFRWEHYGCIGNDSECAAYQGLSPTGRYNGRRKCSGFAPARQQPPPQTCRYGVTSRPCSPATPCSRPLSGPPSAWSPGWEAVKCWASTPSRWLL